MGIWYELKPLGLTRRDNGSRWVFAHYFETPSDRDDGKWFHVFHFRNADRTLFGVKAFDHLIHFPEMRRMAARVVKDEAFRQSLLSDNPELPRLWKRR